jgi:hypothetical protein
MFTKKLKSNIYLLFIPLILIFIFCYSDTEITSKWKNIDITIDGKNTEWGEGTLLKDVNISINACNDSDFVYLCLSSSDKSLLPKILRGGLTIWFDPTESDAETFGIRFPLGAKENEQQNNFSRDTTNQHKKIEDLLASLTEFDIVGKDDEVVERLSLLQAKGIELKIGYDDKNNIVYELKVPLKSSANIPYAIGADITNKISLGIETGEISNNSNNSNYSHNQGTGGGHHRGNFGGNNGGMGGYQSGNNGNGQNRPTVDHKPLKLWVTLQLSSNQ